ncbi:MAG: hypothetical protein HFF39_03445 [Lawsonibacter sp.]|nr:hypothetical protein [Lawsonibacter sp.]
MKYRDLDALLRGDAQAREYFQSLPGYVRDQISTRPDGINSMKGLKNYVQNLTRGDG